MCLSCPGVREAPGLSPTRRRGGRRGEGEQGSSWRSSRRSGLVMLLVILLVRWRLAWMSAAPRTQTIYYVS